MQFRNRIKLDELNELTMALADSISPKDQERLEKNLNNWNFYEGFHWEKIPTTNKPQITKNYCRAFVDKFVAFEFGKGFSIKVPVEDKSQSEENIEGTPITDFLNEVWNYNEKLKLCVEIGQSKSVTGDAWVYVHFERPGEFDDPYEEYPEGRIRIQNMSNSVCFPEYDDHDKDKLTKFTVMYPISKKEESPILKTIKIKQVLYKVTYTKDRVITEVGKEVIGDIPNPYGVIPFVKITNMPLANKSDGISDLDDIIPLNVELNLKDSDISEIIDYHSAPVTIVYGAKLNSLEKGANKMWGGLPKDARVENLTMNTDLGASVTYTSTIKTAMHEIGNVPENALGGSQAISNTSGVALQIVNMPLIEKTRVKRLSSKKGIENINKLILLIAKREGLLEIPEGMKPRDFYNTEVTFLDTLPKDQLIELQQIEAEMRLGIESRNGAMERLGKSPKKVLMELEEDFENNPEFYGHDSKEDPTLNSGMLNGQTPGEEVRKATTGQNVKPETVAKQEKL